ncbi:hypothetical protein RRG08_022557 [Elysia crispata]|uniref:Uncharacterized protein n=1 Tax=Elysia crispata TaxID=231223 RepID=A0AAE0Z1F3_9GAST|nr:hypothetical protein RRG08_022557 [Elysia crispata]
MCRSRPEYSVTVYGSSFEKTDERNNIDFNTDFKKRAQKGILPYVEGVKNNLLREERRYARANKITCLSSSVRGEHPINMDEKVSPPWSGLKEVKVNRINRAWRGAPQKSETSPAANIWAGPGREGRSPASKHSSITLSFISQIWENR